MPERIVGAHRNDANRRAWPDAHTFAAVMGDLEDVYLFRHLDSSLDITCQKGTDWTRVEKENDRIII